MFSLSRATLAVAAQLFAAISTEAFAERAEIPATLVEELNSWIDTATDLPRAREPAKIDFAEPGDLTETSKMAYAIGKVPRGLYEPGTGKITLVRPWSADNPQDAAVLLHELIHHRQEGKHFYCEAAREHSAYSWQRDWLGQRDQPLNVNWIAVVLASSCAARDIHP